MYLSREEIWELLGIRGERYVFNPDYRLCEVRWNRGAD
jgi:hypothetical protein